MSRGQDGKVLAFCDKSNLRQRPSGEGEQNREETTEQRAKLVSTVFDITVYFCSPFLPSSLLPSLPCVLTGVIAFGVRQNRRKIGCTAPL